MILCIHTLLVLFLQRIQPPQISTLKVVLGGQNFKNEFSELVLGVWNLLSNLIRLKNANDCTSSRKSTDSPWSNLAIEICKIAPLDTPNQPLRCKEPSNGVYEYFHTFSYIWKTKEYNEVGRLLLEFPDKMQGRDEFRGWTQLKCCPMT